MLSGKKYNAFTLAEVMIVLLVLTILFAAMAPLITKKRTALGNEDLWSWGSRGLSAPMNASKTNTDGTVFFGVTPTMTEDVTTTFLPRSKVVIRSGLVSGNNIQRQLQLRYGDNNEIGATLLTDNTNLLFGNKFSNLKQFNTDNEYPKNNLAFGYDALENIKSEDTSNTKNNTAFGYGALKDAGSNGDVAIGYNAGKNQSSGYGNVFIGAETGANSPVSGNTLIGYKSKSKGNNNTFIGANSGNSSATTYNNTAIGVNTLNNLTSGGNNIAIGYGALENLTGGSNNVAIGYNACNELEGGASNKTCIGYNSGPKKDVTHHVEAYQYDNVTRTYIGEAPGEGTYGGDAVLEIHNMGSTENSKLANRPGVKSNTTTIINGNLIVKGKTYFTTGSILYPYELNDSYFSVKSTAINNPCATNQITYAFTCGINLTSDRRLKRVGSKYLAGLEELNKIQVYNYKYKNDAKKEQRTGVIAQNLQKVFPNAVSKDENGYLTIRWDEMFYACINALKTLNQRVANLVKRTVTLEKEITKLEKENARLNAKVNSITARIESLKK